MPSEKKEKDIKWLRTNAKKEQELTDTKRKSSFITTFSRFFVHLKRYYYILTEIVILKS